MADVGFIYRVVPVVTPGEAWYHVHPNPLRYIPPGQGMGSFCQDQLGWARKDISQDALDELVQNFGQGPPFV